jgi:hypothetical protein
MDGFDAFSRSDPENCKDPGYLVDAAGSDPITNGNILINDA